MSKSLTWEEFLNSAKEFINLSNKLNDSWILIQKNSDEGNSYLMFEQKVKCNFKESKTASNSDEIDDLVEDMPNEDIASSHKSDYVLLHLEYHVVYSITYQVPILYFKGHKSDGSLISLEDSWRIFTDSTELNYSKSEMLSILTQMEHPILFKPFLALHPCKTSEILGNSLNSKNFIITFLSVMGPFVRLNLNSNYGVELND